MKPPIPSVLTINGGSSSIRFAVYETRPILRRLHGKIDRIGLSGTNLTVSDSAGNSVRRASCSRRSPYRCGVPVGLACRATGRRFSEGRRTPRGTRHEVFRTAARHAETTRRTAPHHAVCPRSSAARNRFDRGVPTSHPELAQVACFDTAFHRTMPPVARRLPIPRRYAAKGVER